MSCLDCEDARYDSVKHWMPWGRAIIGIIACHKHTRQIILALNQAQYDIETEAIGDGED